jgi:hypothetical protein
MIVSWLPPTTKKRAPVNKHQHLIDSLKNERAGYLARGLHDRVSAVDEVLASLGVREFASVEPEVEVAVITKGKKRKKQ